MRFFKKILIALVAIVILGGFFYFIFNKPEESGASKNPFADFFSGESKGITGSRIFSDPRGFIEDKISSVKEVFQEKRGEALDSLKESANEAIDAAQNKVVGVGGGGGNIKVLPVARTGESAYFLISNPEPSEEVQYEVDWGDGSVESGVLTGEEKTISHSWDEKGEFLVNFKISGSESVSESIKVFVTE